MADAVFDFGAAVAEIAKLTNDVQFYADLATATSNPDGRLVLTERRTRLLERLAAAQRDFNERLQALAPSAKQEVGGR